MRFRFSFIRAVGLSVAGATVVAASAGGCQSFVSRGEAGSCADEHWTPPPPGDAGPTGVDRPGVAQAPVLLVRLDRDGAACDPAPLAALAKALNDPAVTDVYVLCPGWASEYAAASGWVRSFLTGLERVRPFAEVDPARPRPYRPVYVGIVWPADVLVTALPDPPVAGGRRTARADADQLAWAEVIGTDVAPEALERIRSALRARGHKGRARRLDDLIARAAELTPPEQVDLADCLLPLYGPEEEPDVPGPRYAVRAGAPPVPRVAESPAAGLLDADPAPLPPLDPRELLAAWKRSVREAAGDVPRAPEQVGDDDSRARRGGLRVVELVRWALRATDLRVMKDRAWRVGRRGVAAVLAQVSVSRRPDARVHVVGHSFGCDALLAALSRPAVVGFGGGPGGGGGGRADGDHAASTGPASSPATATATAAAATAPAACPSGQAPLVDTLLLLQPTASAWAFAAPPTVGPDVAPALQAASRGGNYRPALTAGVCRRVVVTRSRRDWFLGYYAPKALRRPAYEGQLAPDAWAGDELGFATMGAVGPLGVGALAAGPAGGTQDGGYSGTVAPDLGGPFAAAGAAGPSVPYGPPGAGPTDLPSVPLIPVTGTSAPPRYVWDPAAKLVTVDADAEIFSHGDVNDEAIWWLLANQVEAAR